PWRAGSPELTESAGREVRKEETFTLPELLFSAFTPYWQEIFGTPRTDNRSPLYIEGTSVAEQRTPYPVRHIHLDVKALILLFIPLADLCDTREEQRKTESNQSFVEALRPRPKAKS